MKKSLGVFCFYDSQGIVDDYIFYLFDSMKEILSKIIVVVNGEICNESYCKLNNLVDKIVIRENKGYDGAAYKEVLLNNCDVKEWDEVVLFNGTFYGPFVEWKLIFERMRKYDFWGLARTRKYEKTYLDSYFLVFEKRLIRDEAFLDFWRQMKTPNSYFEDFKVFEEPLVEYFAPLGFSWSDWYSENGGEKPDNLSPYSIHTFEELVNTNNFPVIKYKYFSIVHYCEVINNIDFLLGNPAYDYELIKQHHTRLEKNNKLYPFSKCILDDFLEKHDELYIFGHGVYGNGIASYCEYKGKKIKGFVVSNPKEKEEISIGNVALGDASGMIVAVGAGLIQEVREILCDFEGSEHVLFPIYKK